MMKRAAAFTLCAGMIALLLASCSPAGKTGEGVSSGKAASIPAEEKRGAECIAAGDGFALALKKDGTVVAAGDNASGQCDVSRWADLVSVSAGRWHSVGLKSDGAVVAAGDNVYGQADVAQWNDIVSVSAGDQHTAGATADGKAVAVGDDGKGQCDVSGWSGIVAVSCGGWHTVGLKADGTVVAAGDNTNGQCNVSGWRDIVAVSAGEFDTYGLKADGTVVTTYPLAKKDTAMWTGVASMSAGSYHAVALLADGAVAATGLNDDGECNVGGWRDIRAVSAGSRLTVGVKSDGTAVAAGNNEFGQCDVQDWKDIGFPEPEHTKPAESAGPKATMPVSTPVPTFRPISEHVLKIRTVKAEINDKTQTKLKDVTAADETGKEITLPADYGLWFEDGKLESATLAKDSTFILAPDDSLELEEGSRMNVVVTVKGVRYRFQLYVGMLFNYTVVDGEVKLLVDDRFAR